MRWYARIRIDARKVRTSYVHEFDVSDMLVSGNSRLDLLVNLKLLRAEIDACIEDVERKKEVADVG